VGDVFGSLLAIEATMAFFLESTFLGVWIFGWKRLSARMHNASIWLVALAANISAFWILMANGWMQNPVGYAIQNGRAELTSFTALVTNPFAWQQFIHTLSAAYVLAGFFVMGISAWHLIRGNQMSFFRKSFRIAAPFTLVFTLVIIVQGHMHGTSVARFQPAKLAAMESLWETRTHAPQYLIAIPDPANERNRLQLLPIPGALSLMAYHAMDAQVTGLKDVPPQDRPPVLLTFLSFRVMVALGLVLLLMAGWAWRRRNDPARSPLLLRLLPWIIPLPYLAIQLGWILAEFGRQPWIVYGMMRTGDAVSPGVSAGQVFFSLVLFSLIYALLVAVDIFLLAHHSRKGVLSEEGREEPTITLQSGAAPGAETVPA
jgi:cytochrome d ubiquinol oxidase subunit I